MRFLTDRQTISKREYTPEGYLVVKDVKIARTGVQTYAAREVWDAADMPDKYKGNPLAPVRLARLPEDVFEDEALASFQALPLTNNHPGFSVDASNVKSLQVGFSFNDARKAGQYVETDLKFTDAKAIRAIESGKVEVSNGYDAEVVIMDGEVDGEQFDAVQKRIRGNHIALVKRGRAGSNVRLSDNHTPGGRPMRVLLVDGIPFEFEDQAALVVEKLIGRVATLSQELKDNDNGNNVKLTDTVAELETAKASLAQAQGALEAEKAKELTDSQLDELVATRAVLLTDAKSVLGKDVDLKGKDEATVKRLVIAKINDSIDLKDKDDNFVDGVYSSLLATAKKGSAKTLADSLKEGQHLDDEDGLSEFEKKRKKHMQDSANAYKLTGGTK